MKLKDIAQLLRAELIGDGERDIARVAKIEEAATGDVSFLANPKYARFLATTHASAVIVARAIQPPEGDPAEVPALLRVDDPYGSFVKTVTFFHPQSAPVAEGIHPTAVIDPRATLGEEVRVGACAVIGPEVRIGARTMIGPAVVIGEHVTIGEDCILYPHVTVREGCTLGRRVILQPGVVVGGDGFGFAPQADGTYEKIPQIGTVVIEDDVELGANTTVDRATLGETRIKHGVKLDNLIMVAHNVVVGENTVSAAQAGISGSTKIGKNVMIGGQVGFTGHLEIADGTKVGAQSGVHRSVPQPNTIIFGSPAMPQKEAFRIQGAAVQLPELVQTVRDLKAELDRVKARLKSAEPSAERPAS